MPAADSRRYAETKIPPGPPVWRCATVSIPMQLSAGVCFHPTGGLTPVSYDLQATAMDGGR